ncbi:T9SS type A sorting domain-containing protein [candidate division KSB1 bacterium]|nr:T9SS type A sorting domain-containing protein [candidate division KSB1 bacterium]
MIKKKFCVLILLAISVRVSFSQDPNVGDPMYTKWGWMDGNQIRIQFANHAEIGHWPDPLSGEWPQGSGTAYIDGVAFIVAAEAVDINGNTFHTVETQYRECMDNMEIMPWGFYPLPGYCNPQGTAPALSDDPDTWPVHWPGQPDSLDGHWNGYFGMDNFYPDLESYFVMDDDKDLEFDFYPDSTDSSRRGLGIEVSVRGFQWDHVLTEDILFWQYDIINEGTTDYDQVYVGFYFDAGVGNDEGSDDCGFYDELLDLAYAWDYDNIGGHPPNTWSPVAYTGFSLLDTPDHLGLTGFQCFAVHHPDLDEDELVWEAFSGPPAVDSILYVNLGMLASSGPFSLSAGETKQVTMALLFGWDLDDLKRNASFARSFYNGGFSFDTHDVSITSPIGGETLSGSVDINWSASGTGDPLEVDIYYSFDDGNTWTLLAENTLNDGVFTWDTTTLVDGIFYRLMVLATNEQGVGMSISDTSFTINNPVAAAPQVILQSPVGGEELIGSHSITWRAGDADGDMVSVDVLSSTDGGETFNLISSGEDNDGQFEWDTNLFPNGSNYKIKLVVSDGALMGEDESDDIFQVNNPRSSLSDFYPDTLGVVHVAGPGTGSVQVNIVFPSALTYHIYEISFDDTSGDQTTYDVLDLTIGEFVILDAEELTSEVEGPLFDGIRLLIDNDEGVDLIDSLTGWMPGSSSNFEGEVVLSAGALPYPADYEIEFFDQIVGTDSSSTPKDVNFEVRNITEDRWANFRFTDLNGDGFWSSNERITIRERFDGVEYRTWKVILTDTTTGTGEGIAPGEGDVFLIRTTKPFRSGDVFRFPEVITAIAFWPYETNSPYNYSLLQNYPNPFNYTTTIKYGLPQELKITLKVFNILGREVAILVDEHQGAGYHRINWDASSYSSGIYFYQIQAGEFQKIRKMILLK